jgi:hypothetical protein
MYGYEIMNRDFEDYVQMCRGRNAGFVLKHTDPRTDFTFFPEDVTRWYDRAHVILGDARIHMSESRIG